MKRVSVITVNKNNAIGLENTIKSIVKQTYKNYELIVIDGGSTDGSVEVIKKYSENIAYWVSEQDRGIYHAMNKGISQATGEYTIFMNSGDCFISDDTLSTVLSVEVERISDIVAGSVLTKGKWQTKSSRPKDNSFYELVTYPICHQGMFFKTILFDELGCYDESLKIVSDWKFYLLAVIKYQKSIELLDIPIAMIESGGISTRRESDQIIYEERNSILKEYFPYFYEDYLFIRRKKRFSFRNIKIGIVWRVNRFLGK